MKKRKFISICIILCILIECVATVSAEESAYWPYGVKNRKAVVNSYSNSYNGTWVSIIDDSRSYWNDSKAETTITTSIFSSNKILAAQYDDEWYGLFTVNSANSSGYISKFTIQVNARTIYADAGIFDNFAESTVTHEFGHAFFLNDNPPTTKATLMSHSRNRNFYYKPQAYDIINVKTIYETK